MKLSACRAVCLLPVLALMLVGVGCHEDEEQPEVDQSPEVSTFAELNAACSKEAADRLAEQSVPGGVSKLVEHVTAFYPNMLQKPPVVDDAYLEFEHPGQACDEVEETVRNVLSQLKCIEKSEKLTYTDYFKANADTKALLEAATACRINKDYIKNVQCFKKLDEHMAKMEFPEGVEEVVSRVRKYQPDILKFDWQEAENLLLSPEQPDDLAALDQAENSAPLDEPDNSASPGGQPDELDDPDLPDHPEGCLELGDMYDEAVQEVDCMVDIEPIAFRQCPKADKKARLLLESLYACDMNEYFLNSQLVEFGKPVFKVEKDLELE